MKMVEKTEFVFEEKATFDGFFFKNKHTVCA